MKRITGNFSANSQICYFTSCSLMKDDQTLIFISDSFIGSPNIFAKNLSTGEEKRLTGNTDGTLKSYVYFNGNENKGLGIASVSVDSNNGFVYFIKGICICKTDTDGNLKIIAKLPENQVTAFTHVSADGKKICVPTTDKRALESDEFVNDSPGYELSENGKNEVISGKPNYNIDERVQNEELCSYIRVYDTETGEEILTEKVERAWITHVQFCPTDSNLILYNHEWPSDCGIRRMWLWDGKNHTRLRTENSGKNRSKDDWTCHEMWQSDGKYIIYHGKYSDGTAYIGRVSPKGGDNTEISLPEKYRRYGHFTAGNSHNNLLVSDGYYHKEGQPENENWGGEWISVQTVDWDNRKIKWVPLCMHSSIWDCQDSHPHPIFSHSDTSVYFTSNRDGKRAVFKVDINE